MIKAWVVTDTAVSISDGTLCDLLDWDGLGGVDLTRHASRGPMQHGDTDEGFLLEPRLITLVLGVKGDTPADLAARRKRLLNLFSALREPITLRFELEDGQILQIDTVRSGRVSMAGGDRPHERYQKVGVILKANDPAFYEPDWGSLTFSLGGGGGAGFTVPTPVPTEIGASTINEATAITYPGNWISYPLIRITGPITSPVVTNQTTGEKLDFTGVTIAAGRYYDIDTRYGHKTVLLDDGTRKIHELTDDSDLSTFHIAPDPEAPGGVNSIAVSGSGITTASQIEISWPVRYDGGP